MRHKGEESRVKHETPTYDSHVSKKNTGSILLILTHLYTVTTTNRYCVHVQYTAQAETL